MAPLRHAYAGALRDAAARDPRARRLAAGRAGHGVGAVRVGSTIWCPELIDLDRSGATIG